MENIFDSKYFIISLDLKFYSFCLMFPRSSKSFVIFCRIRQNRECRENYLSLGQDEHIIISYMSLLHYTKAPTNTWFYLYRR